MDALVYDIWLSLALVPDTPSFRALLSRFSDSYSIYSADKDEIASIEECRESDKTALLDKDLTRAEGILKFCTEKEVGILTYFDERFPESLRSIPTPPVLLYYRGQLPDFDRSFSVGIVGTRSLSKYGRKNAFSIAHDLSRAGAIIVSGMAIGIDGVAHAGALCADGITVAVLGSGIDVCYPMAHKTLARAIVKKGCVLTEYAPGTKPAKFNFPRRNRIISGLSAATVVIEGREISGALHTARHAIKQERPVYALPGSVDSKNSEASLVLLRNGAKTLVSADDVVRDFEPLYRGILNPFKLSEPKEVNMDEMLTLYRVSAVSQEDGIFEPKRVKKERNAEKNSEAIVKDKAASEDRDVQILQKDELPEREPRGFDARTLKIYKMIPTEGSCQIESLVGEDLSLRDVMKAILKLEMSRFVTVLPGERVARNLLK